MTEWLNTNLSALLEFPLPLDMIEYINSIVNERDLEEYLKTLLDFNNAQHRKFFHELLQRRKGKVIQEGYKKSEVDINYITPKAVEKKKKGKNQPEEHQSKESRPTDNSDVNPKEKSKKKSKFVNLYSQEGQAKDVVLLKGRIKCDCQASKHKLINNCLKCGRIVCEQEGSGPCLFCGNLVCSREEQEMINSGTKQSSQLLQKLMDQKPPGWVAAMEQRNRLLEYDRTSEKRTRVIDDESDYFSTNSVWLSPSEREQVMKREEEIRARQHSSRKDRQITFDIIGGKAVESPQFDDFYRDDGAFRDISDHFKSPSSEDNIVDPSMTELIPKFQESVVLHKEHQQRNTRSYNIVSRIQDKEFLEMVDEGLCLSMHQPWASLLVAGIKQHEGRSWYTSHRGRLWIAATAKQPTREEIQEHEHIYRILKGDELTCPNTYPVSCLLGCVNLTNVLPQEEYREKYPEGESDCPFVFICENPQQLPIKFPIKGKHKIYHLDPKIHHAAQKTLLRVAQLRAEKASEK